MNRKYLYLSCLIILLMGAITITALFKNSYAITTSNSLPTTTFKSNNSSSNTINLIKDAIGENSTYDNFLDNFNVQKDYRTKNNNFALYSIMKNLEFPTSSEKFELTADNPKDVEDKKLLYIMMHGYNNTNSENNIFSSEKYGEISNDYIKEYITQIAIWLYLYENQSSLSEYCIPTNIDNGINACSFYNNSSYTLLPKESVRGIINQAAANKDYKYLNYILDLVESAKNYNYTESNMINISNTSIGYDYHNNYIMTSTINPFPTTDSKNNYLNYSVEIEDPDNYGVYITNSDGIKITNTNDLTEGFKVYIPLKKDITEMDLTKVRISIKGSFLDDIKGYSYRVTSSTNNLVDNDKQKYASQIISYVPIKYVYTGFNLKNFVKISNVDAKNGKELAGSTLVIKKKGTDTEIAKWVSKEEPHYVMLNEATYELYEVSAPDGFEQNKESVELKVENDKIINYRMESNHTPVAYSFTTSDLLTYIIGILLFSISGGMLYYSFKVNKTSAQ